MKIRSLVLAIVAAFATSAAFADAPAPEAAALKSAPREQTLLDEVGAAMREILRAVSPEIRLPAVEVKLPPLAPRRG
jgi:hypothetical protein